MKRLLLSNRLGAVLKYIPQGSAVADVGTDHGYIPVYLAQNNIASSIVATDVRSGPLSRAKASAKEHGVSERIEFVLTNGLVGLEDRLLDTFVIAGMGGETMAEILGEAPWTRSDNVRLILQPQSKLSELLSWLEHFGYNIIDATLALDDGRIYPVILAGVVPGSEKSDFFEVLLGKRETHLPMYLTGLIAKLQHAVAGLEKASTDSDGLKQKKRELEAFKRMKGETDKWQK